MSLEEDIESRIIMENGPDSPWQLISGPFEEETFSDLPKDKWTLLIQGVDQWVPEAADLLQDFNFIPNWRIDDLMISFATNGGSVGPHYDQYDVFLLQAEGQREWRIGQMCSEHDDFLKETKLRILSQFEETDRWTLEPGDMLYLPPRLAHYGISQGNGQTYSIGFRAPSHSEIMHSLVDQLDASSNEDKRYGDPDLKPQDNCGEINEAALQQVREFMIQALQDPILLSDTLGKLMTEPKYPHLSQQNDDEDGSPTGKNYSVDDLKYDLQTEETQRELHARFSFNYNNDQLNFYAGGKVYPLSENSLEFVKYLTCQRIYNNLELREFCKQSTNETLLLTLWQDGYFFSDD